MTFNALGQSDKTTKLDISISGGLSLPVGSYGNKSPLKSAIYVEGAPALTVKGFAKDRSGFAKTGYCYNLEIKYKLTTSLRLLLLAGTYSNTVETDGMSDFLTQVKDNRETKVEEDDYSFLYFTPGIGYYYSLNKFELGLNLFMGYSISSFPYYKFIFLYTTLDPPPIFAHYGPKPDLGAFTLGTSLSATYNVFNRFRIGIDILYQRANFEYNMSPMTIPGGNPGIYNFSDILKARVINTGLKIGYSF